MNHTDRHRHDISWRAHLRWNARLALPLVIGQLATIGIWTSDTIAMGQIDSVSLAAGALASRYYQPLYFLALGISLAVGPLVAQGIGAGDERQVRRAFRQGMAVAFTLGMIAVPLMTPAHNGSKLPPKMHQRKPSTMPTRGLKV